MFRSSSKKSCPTNLKMLTKSDVLVFILLSMTIFEQGIMEGDNNVGCPSTERLALGSQGYITCTFPTDLSEVHWFDDVSESSDVRPIVTYRLHASDKDGTGIVSGEYDILSNGTLVITNVTLRHEKQYKVLACPPSSNCIHSSEVSVKVTVYPSMLSPSVTSCNNWSDCLITFTKAGHLTCEFDSARPPVDLKWVRQIGGTDIQIEKQTSFSELNSDDVTHKSYAVLNETVNNNRLLAVYICKPTWITTGLVTERKILVDFSEEIDLLNPPSKETVYFEINRRSELICKVSNFSEIVWKKISSGNSIETIGLMFEGVIHTNEEFSDDIIVSTDGSLIFKSLQLHHEGTYACIYDNGRDVKGIQTSHVQILVPPSPPYIQIKECKENKLCILRGNRSGSLDCLIHGVRPEVSLTWIVPQKKFIQLEDFRTFTHQRGQLTDVSTSVHYELTHDVVCGTSVELQCQVGHPISQIIQPYAKVVIYADECNEHQNDEGDRHGFPASVVVTIAVLAVCSLGIVCVMIYCMKKYHKMNQTHDEQSADSAVEAGNPMLTKPNGNAIQASDSTENDEKKEHGEIKQREVCIDDVKVPLEHCDGNGVHTGGSGC